MSQKTDQRSRLENMYWDLKSLYKQLEDIQIKVNHLTVQSMDDPDINNQCLNLEHNIDNTVIHAWQIKEMVFSKAARS